MALTKVPTDWLENYSFTEPDITIPRGDLDGITAAEANATTGDIREIVRGLLEALFQHHQSEAAADRLTQFRISKSVSPDPVSNTQEINYSVRCVVSAGDVNVIPEPA